MAELVIKVDNGLFPAFENDDVMSAYNRRTIRRTYAEQICFANRPLLQFYLATVSQYRMDRINRSEVRRTTTASLSEEVFGPRPNARGEYIHVEQYVASRLAHPAHRIFGTAGREFWFGGRKDTSHAKLDLVWAEIERYTAYRESQFERWRHTPAWFKKCCIVAVEDFTDDQANELTEPLWDETDPSRPVRLKARRRGIDWAHLPGVSSADRVDIRDRTRSVDRRELRTFTRLEYSALMTGKAVT